MAFGEHWEWRGFGDLANAVRTQIQQLSPKFGAGVNVTDQYLWLPECKVNVKVRQKDLKFKFLLDRADEGFEKWREAEAENYPFPLNPAVVAKLETALGTSFPADMSGKILETYQSLLDVLPRCTPPVIRVTIEKFRTTYIYPYDGQQILVELAEIRRVEIDDQYQENTYTSVSLEGVEGAGVADLRHVHDALGLPDTLQAKGYLQLIEELVEGHVLDQP